MRTTKTLKKTLTLSLILTALICLIGMTPTASAGVSVGIRVGAAPPPLRQEVVSARPGPDYAWIPGSWEWRHHDYAWVGGRWARPPHRGAVWVAPRHEMRGHNHYWISGHWR
ncbi:MAG TPA: YXWGXW repeat-containing protein [Thermoanaerobaculia bacterium]|jgi:hypothetical protein